MGTGAVIVMEWNYLLFVAHQGTWVLGLVFDE